ncbi:hypothetical protein BLNAU_11104 [Blattamonas nauphoetae]|uniref:Uncharacterized protein n=1 Tax=Blattamonas nauphoetae TaxID=2049346 RepID=A0ABQ9XR75_9EUKA|nr:hypothetical protein BLNAU_11104 [Blattamonas nauphoetae]
MDVRVRRKRKRKEMKDAKRQRGERARLPSRTSLCLSPPRQTTLSVTLLSLFAKANPDRTRGNDKIADG